jgi:hypothetical protein
MDRGIPDGDAVVLEPSQLQTLLRKSFNLGIDSDPRKPRALNRLEMAKGLVGVAEANAIAAEAIAIETEEIANSEAFALHAAAFNGMPDPVFHLMERDGNDHRTRPGRARFARGRGRSAPEHRADRGDRSRSR